VNYHWLWELCAWRNGTEWKAYMWKLNTHVFAGVLYQGKFLFAFLLTLAFRYGKDGNWPLVFRYPTYLDQISEWLLKWHYNWTLSVTWFKTLKLAASSNRPKLLYFCTFFLDDRDTDSHRNIVFLECCLLIETWIKSTSVFIIRADTKLWTWYIYRSTRSFGHFFGHHQVELQ